MRIDIEGMSAGYGGSEILKGIDLHLDGPGLTCIIGPNGVGKSTLVKCMNKLLEPASGKVSVNGRDVKEMTRKEISEAISYVPVQSEDVFSMPVFDTVLVGRANRSKWKTDPKDVVKVKKVLEVLGISELSDRPFDELSAGQHQTVAIARGLVQETEILILDEPTSNLDIRHQVFITSLMHEIAVSKGVMVIMISHNLNIASMFADRVVLMAEPGIVKNVGTAEEVITRENISEVYGVDCEVVMHKGRPAILLENSIFRRGRMSPSHPSTLVYTSKRFPYRRPQGAPGMLIRFWVEGYRCFGRRAELDLTDSKNYRFGKECLRGDLLDKIVVLGNNNSGKTSFGYAITDIVSTVGGFSKDIGQRNEGCFLNKDLPTDRATFHYELSRRGSVVVYEYSKTSPDAVVAESLRIDRRPVFEYDLSGGSEPFFDLSLLGTSEPPKPDGTSVVLSMSRSRRIDPDSPAGVVLEFATHTLYYMAMWRHDIHMGMIDGDDDAERFVTENGLTDGFRSFLKDVCSIDLDLRAEGGRLMVRKGNGSIPFADCVSRGTMIACRLYAWTARCRDREALIYFDDFDDMFHYKTAENAIRTIISRSSSQCIFVTHNTGLVSNDFLRPDCCFIMGCGGPRSLASLSDKDIRRGHNLEKMLREGAFDS